MSRSLLLSPFIVVLALSDTKRILRHLIHELSTATPYFCPPLFPKGALSYWEVGRNSSLSSLEKGSSFARGTTRTLRHSTWFTPLHVWFLPLILLLDYPFCALFCGFCSPFWLQKMTPFHCPAHKFITSPFRPVQPCPRLLPSFRHAKLHYLRGECAAIAEAQLQISAASERSAANYCNRSCPVGPGGKTEMLSQAAIQALASLVPGVRVLNGYVIQDKVLKPDREGSKLEGFAGNFNVVDPCFCCRSHDQLELGWPLAILWVRIWLQTASRTPLDQPDDRSDTYSADDVQSPSHTTGTRLGAPQPFVDWCTEGVEPQGFRVVFWREWWRRAQLSADGLRHAIWTDHRIDFHLKLEFAEMFTNVGLWSAGLFLSHSCCIISFKVRTISRFHAQGPSHVPQNSVKDLCVFYTQSSAVDVVTALHDRPNASLHEAMIHAAKKQKRFFRMFQSGQWNRYDLLREMMLYATFHWSIWH